MSDGADLAQNHEGADNTDYSSESFFQRWGPITELNSSRLSVR